MVKVWVGLKKVGINGGECCWEGRAEEEVIGGLFIMAAEWVEWGRGLFNSKLEG